jgi:hypothetical protein
MAIGGQAPWPLAPGPPISEERLLQDQELRHPIELQTACETENREEIEGLPVCKNDRALIRQNHRILRICRADLSLVAKAGYNSKIPPLPDTNR